VFANAHWMHVDCAVAGRYSGIPVTLHLHEEASPGIGARLRGGAVKLADASVAVSRAVADNLPLSVRGKVNVVPNGVDIDVLRPGPADPEVRRFLGATDDEVLVVALTRLDPVKRIEDVIAAFARAVRGAPDVSARLAIVGTTSGYPAYATEVQARAHGSLGDRVVFAGRRQDVADILRASDVLLHAGLVEGMPLSMLEAQACGVPVVAYAAAGVSEAVVHGRTGFVAPPRKVADLGSSLSRLLADPELRVSMGRAGRDHVLAHHTLERQADRLAALTERLAATRSAGAA
jgi:glycosyltransferase involved in cell wall biosynthesis